MEELRNRVYSLGRIAYFSGRRWEVMASTCGKYNLSPDDSRGYYFSCVSSGIFGFSTVPWTPAAKKVNADCASYI